MHFKHICIGILKINNHRGVLKNVFFRGRMWIILCTTLMKARKKKLISEKYVVLIKRWTKCYM